MVTRIRIDGHGATAAEVEGHINAVASAISDMLGDGEEVDLQLVIQREEREPAGHTAFSGRGLLYLNVASDAPQVWWLKRNTGVCSTAPGVPLSPGQYMAVSLGLEPVEEG